jgi:type II secretory pathway pseudopilin PulG
MMQDRQSQPPNTTMAQPSIAYRRFQKGFALVVTLSLMILLTILAVGLLSLSSASLRSSSQTEAMSIARANARLALMMAIGELQKHAGPDQRITARAEILDTTPSTPQADGVNQPYWTGVWKTGDKPTEDQRSESIGSNATETAEWLVSTSNPNKKLDPKAYSGSTAGPNRNAVIMGNNQGANQNTIIVPLVKAGDSSTGKGLSSAYAYWVSDEGLKTKVNIKDPTLGASPSGNEYTKNLSHFTSPQSNAAHKILPSPLNKDLRGDDNLTKVISLETVQLLPKSPQKIDLREVLPDVTACSWGVLANVRKGGLKCDLTAAFEDDGDSNAGQYAALKKISGSGMDGECLYRSSSKWNYGATPEITAAPFNGSAAMDGLRWRSLYHYYNLYKNRMPINRTKGGNQLPPSGIQSSNTGFTSGAHTIPQRVHGYNDDGLSGGAYMADPIVPVTLLARVDVAMESFVDPSTGKYRLRLRYYPMMVLWNPYSVRLASSINPVQSFYTNMFRRWNIKITAGGTGVPPFNTDYNLFQGGGYLPTLITKATDTAIFQPGEIKIFALADKDIRRTTLGDPASSNVCVFNELSSTGELADWSQYYDLPWPGTSNPADTIDVTVSNKSLDANATYNNGGPLTAWPDGATYNARISTYSPPSVGAKNSWPNPKPAISTMAGNPFLVVGFNYRSKGIKQSADTNYFNSQFNPPMFMGNSSSLSNINTVGYWREIYARNFKPYTAVSEVQNFNGRTSWGLNSVGVDPVSTANSQLVLIDVPLQPMFSLGQFAHLSPFYYASSGAYQAQYFSSFFIGGSLASPNVSMNTNVNSSGGTVYMDHSYLANLNLFDGYFFSTVPASGQRTEDSDKYVMRSEDLKDAIAGDKPLPNNRMRFYRKGGNAPKPENLRDVNKAAANLLLDGAFNINSTSVNAWRSLLGSLSGNDIKLWNPSANSSDVLKNLENPIPRFWSTTNKGSVNQPFEGMRDLTDSQVTKLAEQIVRQIKERGPFLHMGDFLNRRLASSETNKSRISTMGALQAAIEESKINHAISSAGSISSLNSMLNGDPFGANVYGNPMTARTGPGAGSWTTELTSANTSIPANTATGIPGYLMQQDLVQAFAPVMTARSDTFLIRGYGEAKNAQGVVQARAWCEATIQRMPEYLDQSDPALSGSNTYGKNLGDATPPYDRRTGSSNPAAIVNKTNETFGRKHAITSFRWLNEKEI